MPRKLTGRPPGRPRYPEILTPAEQRVLMYLREGLPNADIAVRLGISPDGVKYHVSNMLGKLDLHGREELARWRPPRSTPVHRLWGAIPLLWKWAAASAVGAGAIGVGAVVLVAAISGDTPSDADSALADGAVSVGIDGEPGNGPSNRSALSGNGRFVTFESRASNLVPDDTNGASDIFVRDRMKGTTTRVSVGPGGEEADGASENPLISRDGRFVAFESRATNLVPGTTVSVDESWAALPPSSKQVFSGAGDPRFAPVRATNIFLRDLEHGLTTLVSVALDGRAGNLGSAGPSISADGRFVAFDSIATNLVAGDTNAGQGGLESNLVLTGVGGDDVFVRDMRGGTTRRVSVQTGGGEADGSSSNAAISGDGSMVAFTSDAGNLIDGERAAKHLNVHDVAANTTKQLVFGESILGIFAPELSQDGRWLAVVGHAFRPPTSPGVPSTGTAASEITLWLFDLETGSRAAIAPGRSASGALSPVSMTADASFIAWMPLNEGVSAAEVYDRSRGVSEPVTAPPDVDADQLFGYLPALSADGHAIAYGATLNYGGSDASPAQIVVQSR